MYLVIERMRHVSICSYFGAIPKFGLWKHIFGSFGIDVHGEANVDAHILKIKLYFWSLNLFLGFILVI